MTLIKQEKLVFILVILYIRVRDYLCVFYKIVYGYPMISNFGYPVPKITENAQPLILPLKDFQMLKYHVVKLKFMVKNDGINLSYKYFCLRFCYF